MSVDFSQLSYKALQAECRARGLRASGRAADLVSRLTDHDRAPAVIEEPWAVQVFASAAFQSLLQEGVGTDVTFLAGAREEVVRAHKSVLMAHSAVLQAMLQVVAVLCTLAAAQEEARGRRLS